MEIDLQTVALLDACARGKLLGGELWGEEYLEKYLGVKQENPEQYKYSLEQYMRECGIFFHEVAEHGLAQAAVIMSDDQSWEKFLRREGHDRALRRCLPDAEERLRLFEEVLAKEQDHPILVMADRASSCGVFGGRQTCRTVGWAGSSSQRVGSLLGCFPAQPHRPDGPMALFGPHNRLPDANRVGLLL